MMNFSRDAREKIEKAVGDACDTVINGSDFYSRLRYNAINKATNEILYIMKKEIHDYDTKYQGQAEVSSAKQAETTGTGENYGITPSSKDGPDKPRD